MNNAQSVALDHVAITRMLEKSERLTVRLKKFDDEIVLEQHPMRDPDFSKLLRSITDLQIAWMKTPSSEQALNGLLNYLATAHLELDNWRYQPKIDTPEPVKQAPFDGLVFPSNDGYKTLLDYVHHRAQVDTNFMNQVQTVMVGNQVMKLAMSNQLLFIVFENTFPDYAVKDTAPQLARPELVIYDYAQEIFRQEFNGAMGPGAVGSIQFALLHDIYPAQLFYTIESPREDDHQATLVKNIMFLARLYEDHKLLRCKTL